MTPLTTPFQKQGISFFSALELDTLDKSRLPKHIAIIPDGNRRWAKLQESMPAAGHREGADNLMNIVRAGKEIGIKTMTFYLFSTENWNRSQDEVDALMWLLPSYLTEQRQTMIDEGVRLETIGDLSRLPPDVLHVVNETKAATAQGKGITFVMALNYGSRDELCRAFKKMAADIQNKSLGIEEIDLEKMSQYLDTAQWEDPDLLIRTSGEMRVSNFLLWQISYAEIHIEEVLWPDFTPHHLLKAIQGFQKRERRLGGGD